MTLWGRTDTAADGSSLFLSLSIFPSPYLPPPQTIWLLVSQILLVGYRVMLTFAQCMKDHTSNRVFPQLVMLWKILPCWHHTFCLVLGGYGIFQCKHDIYNYYLIIIIVLFCFWTWEHFSCVAVYGGSDSSPVSSKISSQVTYVTMVPRVGNETLRPLGVATGNALSVTRSEDTYEKTPPVGRRQPMTSLPAYHNISAAGRIHHQLLHLKLASEAWLKAQGTQCLIPHSGNHGYIRNLRRSPSWELELRPLGVATGNVIPTSPCWGECKPISQKRRALSQLYPA